MNFLGSRRSRRVYTLLAGCCSPEHCTMSSLLLCLYHHTATRGGPWLRLDSARTISESSNKNDWHRPKGAKSSVSGSSSSSSSSSSGESLGAPHRSTALHCTFKNFSKRRRRRRWAVDQKENAIKEEEDATHKEGELLVPSVRACV